MRSSARNQSRIGRPFVRGFTLIEMLMVVVIIGILAAIVVPNLTKTSDKARLTAAKAQISVFKSSLARFEIDTGSFPMGHSGLQALIQRPANVKNWNGPYMEKIPKDPWGNDYIYMCPGKHNPDGYDIICVGRDGVAGTDDDITSWALDD